MKKLCKDCKKELDISNFYKHNDNADGYLNKCKDCVRDRVQSHRNRNIDKVREYDRLRSNLPHRIERRKRRSRIYNIVRKAVRNGEIIKFDYCEDCRCSNKRLEGHHEDYRKPKEVIWLCKSCHMKRHRK